MKEDIRSADQGRFTARIIVWLLAVLTMVSGCSPITRHQIVSTIFDGVPSYPPPDEFCTDYFIKSRSIGGEKGPEEAAAGQQGSRHLPYEEKKCSDCHDKQKEGGLVATKGELCFRCHADFIKGAFVHGPVAVGECMACHEPHSARYGSLLKADKGSICLTCHREKRLSAMIHDKSAVQKMACPDCHDPHYGNVVNFIR